MPWREIAGLRDVLIHRYSTIDLEKVWKIASEDVPGLKTTVEEALARAEAG